MLRLIPYCLQILDPILIPLCFCFAWGFIFLLTWTLWRTIQDTAQRSRQMHQIPCSHCQFFTNSYFLKCTVRPDIANTEQAICCIDYAPHPSDLINS